MYKVFIPSAGLGTRLGDFSKNLNKALVSVDNKPVISHVIEKFPKNIEIVIALGHKGALIKDYINLAHPDRRFTFVEVDNYCDPGAGLGYSILQCKDFLQCPFIFCTNDSLVLEEIPEPSMNWMGFAETHDDNQYRTIKVDGAKIRELLEKNEDSTPYTYIGLSGIHNYKEFWDQMVSGVNYGSIMIGESYGLRHLIKTSDVKAKRFTWFDTGNIEELERTREYFKKDDGLEILEKPSEAIWFTNDKVIKYSADREFIRKRIERSQILSGYVPEVVDKKENMYSYKMIKGDTISKLLTVPLFLDFLKFIEGFWTRPTLPSGAYDDFEQGCMSFYKDKTYKRVKQYFDRFQQDDSSEFINGMHVPKLHDLLDKVDWSYMADGRPSRYHGDLHFENILVSENADFILLDWRQEFADSLEHGDLYYDLAKLLHGMIVSHELVNKEMFVIEKKANVIKFDILRKNIMVECEREFESFIINNNYDIRKVRILTALVFLNIAALHHYPYSEFLFYLGKYQLNNLLANEP